MLKVLLVRSEERPLRSRGPSLGSSPTSSFRSVGRSTALPAAHCTRLQVEDLNAKWQRYDASRDEYVRGLRAQLRGLQAPQPEAELMRKEIARLNRQLEERISECAGAARELAAARERAQMLEQQVGGQDR